VRDLITGPRRFVELQRVLPGISTEQLRSRLNRMVADGMLTRKRYREVPPRVDYELTERARSLAPVLGELARWGYEWAWGAPRPSELVDVTAVFRLLPGLVAANGAAEGTSLLTVSDGHNGRPAHSLLSVNAQGATVTEIAEPRRTDAALAGPAAAWVQALEPLGDPAGLARAGREDLVAFVLGLLTLGRSARAELPAAESA
jgi:DNA-binding HxlR family transcriptional regulator